MPLPLPRPAAVIGLSRSAVDQAVGSAASVAALPARAFGVLTSIETLVERIGAVVDRVERTLDRTDRVVAEADKAVTEVAVISAAATAAVENASAVARAATTVVGEAERVATAAGVVVGQTEAIVARAEVTAATADELLGAYETTLRRGAPMAHRFVEQLTPEEIDAAIRLVDELPKLTEHLTADVLPILATLDRVGPDIHDLLEVTRDLKLAVAGIPGLGLLRRRGENRRADDEADPLAS